MNELETKLLDTIEQERAENEADKKEFQNYLQQLHSEQKSIINYLATIKEQQELILQAFAEEQEQSQEANSSDNIETILKESLESFKSELVATLKQQLKP